MKKELLALLFVLLFIPIYYLNSQIVINEILASNFKTLLDEDYDEPDWIELYNNSYQTINLGGYRISDKNNFSKAWVLPDYLLQPNEFYLLYADDKNRKSSDKFIIEASGVGIKADVRKDGFRFHYLIFNGDFDISVRLHSVSGMYEFGKSGLIVREELTDISKYAGIFALHPSQKLYSYLERTVTNDYPDIRIHFGAQDYPYHWLRLKRVGDSLFAYAKYDGYNWSLLYSGVSSLPNRVYAGIAVSACDPNNKMYAKLSFSELLLNGNSFDFENLHVVEFNTSIKGKSYYSKEAHTNFKLSADGEKLFLWDSYGNLVDSLSFGQQRTNVSYGRYPDGSQNFVFSTQLTPLKPNSDGFSSLAEVVTITPESNYSDTSFNAIFNYNSDSATIYYTTNTRIPDKNSVLNGNDTILIDKTTLLRAKLFKENELSDRTTSRAYFLNERFNLPVISIIADSFDLWNNENGILVEKNLFSGREIAVHLDFWERKGKASFSTEAGMRLHGQATRTEIPQKSLRFYSRTLYGKDVFDFPFWGKGGAKESDKFILRNSGQDWYNSMLRDGYCNVLGQKLPHCITLAYRPVVAYLNGEYWGLYNLRQRFDEDFIAETYKVPEESINYVEDNTLKNGSSITFFTVVDSILKSDINDSSTYRYAIKNFDLDNLKDYVIFRIFTGSYDWPDQNNKFWSSTKLDGKWRWILHDFDLSIGYKDAVPDINMFEHIKSRDCYLSKLILKLFTNENFRIEFISLFADYLNSVFLPEETIYTLDSLANNIRSEIPFHIRRWDKSAEKWEMQIDTIRNFLLERPENVFLHIRWFFNLEGETILKLSSNEDDACSFEVNTLKINSSSWSGKYFKDIPIRIKCKPKEGYKFVRWDYIRKNKSEICLTTQNDTLKLKAVVVKSDIIADSGIVINEIMYNPSQDRDCGDWFELYNSSNNPVELTNWWFKTRNFDNLKINDPIILLPNEYLIICNNDTLFRKYYKMNGILTSNHSFELAQNDYIKLYNSKSFLKDEVNYSNENPWDANADGTGSSLELINPSYDNNLPKNWKASDIIGGSPWQENTCFVKVRNNELFEKLPLIYPNPAKEKIFIELDQYIAENISISIYNLLGEELIRSTPNINFNNRLIETDISSLAKGIYILKIYAENKQIRSILFIVN